MNEPGTLVIPEKVSEYIKLMREYGHSSKEAEDFRDKHIHNEEFREVAVLSRLFLIALNGLD